VLCPGAFHSTSDIQKHRDHKIESTSAFSGNDNAAVAVGLIAALNLDAKRPYRSPRIWMYADEVISFVLARGLIRQDIAPHQVSLH
jgi:hypothetical protein